MTKLYIKLSMTLILLGMGSFQYGYYTSHKEIEIAKQEAAREEFWNDINNEIVFSCIDCPFQFGMLK